MVRKHERIKVKQHYRWGEGGGLVVGGKAEIRRMYPFTLMLA